MRLVHDTPEDGEQRQRPVRSFVVVVGPLERGDHVVVHAQQRRQLVVPDALQARAFAEAGADLVTAVTMTYADEAIGIVRAAGEAGVPVAIGFTVETDGRLPSGQRLRDAIEQVDAATDSSATCFMVNWAHPDHFVDVFADEGTWLHRIGAIRANASRMSHDELDEAEELDRGNPAELAADYVKLARLLPGLCLVGGCCGTDHEHVAHISAALGEAR